MRGIRWLAATSLLLAGLAACTSTAVPTAAPAPTPTPAAVQSPTRPPSPTLAPTAAPTVKPSPAATATPATVKVTVYFTDRKSYNTGTPPFEVGVERTVPAGANLPEAVLAEFFKGPTAAEQAKGLEKVASGFTGFRAVKVQGGIARVYLSGPCQSHGATYTIAQPIIKNLLQFPEIKYVKIYDADGTTEEPDGATNSIPVCLEP